MLGDVGGRRADRDGPKRPVPEHQHVRLPGRDGQSAVGRVHRRAARRAVLHAVVHAHGEAVQPVAAHRTPDPPQPHQGGHVRAPPGRPARGVDGQVLRCRPGGRGRPAWRAFPGRVPRKNQRGARFLRQQRPSGGGRKFPT